MRKTVGGFRDKVVSLFKSNMLRITANKLSKLKIQKQFEEGNLIKSIRNFFKQGKEKEAIEEIVIRDIRTLFEQKDDYCKPISVGNFWTNNYIECESNDGKNKNTSVKEYVNKIKPYLKDIVIDLQKFGTSNIQLTIVINFISSKDTNKEQVMHSKSDNIEVMTYDNANEFIRETFDWFFQDTKLI